MYKSLEKCTKDFHLYIFALCDESYNVLKKLKLKHATIISLNEFEDKELLEAKKDRTQGEYCWTCSSSTILYCLNKYNLEMCTYIDADLYFYSDPRRLIDEMKDNSVLITEHNYAPVYDMTKLSGKYCVQFITFKNNEDGLRVLNWWRNACLKWCYGRFEDGKFGDQKYLDDWCERFKGVHVVKDKGAGIAPWNSIKYDFTAKGNNYTFIDIYTKEKFDLIFYHFHNVKLDNNGKLDKHKFSVYEISKKLIRHIYRKYLDNLHKYSKKIKRFDKNIKVITPLKPKLKVSIKIEWR